MNRERDFYRNMRDDARDSINEAEVFDVSPPQLTVKPNYVSAVVWTVVVASVVCAIYTGFLMFMFYEVGLEEKLKQATSEAIYNLESRLETQNKEIIRLQEENKKIYNHIKFWAPFEKRLPPGVKETWDLPFYGVPKYEFQSMSLTQEADLCLPFLE